MKTLIRIGLSAWLLASSWTHAQSLGSPAPDVGAGKKRAAVCFACHNADGISKIPGTPHLAGQERGYLENAIRAYRDGRTRQDPAMNAMAKPLSDRDILNIAAYYSLQTRMNNGQTATQALELIERTRPVGTLVVEASTVTTSNTEAAPAAMRSGEDVYKAACTACHSTGAAQAPKTGDKTAWAPRLAQGNDTLVKHALQGLNAMPAKGGCRQCNNEEVKAAVEYITGQSQ